MAKAYLYLADGFEEIEALTVVDILRRAGSQVDMVSVSGSRTVTGSHSITVTADRLFGEADEDDADLYVLPGGMPGTRHLREYQPLCDLLVRAKAAGRKVAAICAAPSVLGALGLLEGERAVSYPTFLDQLGGAGIGTQPVEVSGSVTTSWGMGTAIPFALSLAGQLEGEEQASAVAESILFDGLVWKK